MRRGAAVNPINAWLIATGILMGIYDLHGGQTPANALETGQAALAWAALLAYLVLEPREHVETELAALLWPEIGDHI